MSLFWNVLCWKFFFKLAINIFSVSPLSILLCRLQLHIVGHLKICSSSLIIKSCRLFCSVLFWVVLILCFPPLFSSAVINLPPRPSNGSSQARQQGLVNKLGSNQSWEISGMSKLSSKMDMDRPDRWPGRLRRAAGRVLSNAARTQTDGHMGDRLASELSEREREKVGS